jgi:hypothetical protein
MPNPKGKDKDREFITLFIDMKYESMTGVSFSGNVDLFD